MSLSDSAPSGTIEPAEKLSKQTMKPHLAINPRFFATSRSSHRAYKYFSSISLYHASKGRDTRFEGIVDKIKYVKNFKVPMVVGTPNSNFMGKKIKSIKKTIASSTNILSYGLSRGKQIQTSMQYQKRAFIRPEFILEGFLQKTSNINSFRYQRTVKVLKLGFVHASYASLKPDLFELLPKLRSVKHLSIALFVVSSEDLTPLITAISLMPNLDSLEMNGLPFDSFTETLPMEALRIKKLKIRSFSSPSQNYPFLKAIRKIANLECLNICWPDCKIDFSEGEIKQFLGKYGFETPPIPPVQADSNDKKFCLIEDKKFMIMITKDGFVFRKK